MKVIDAHPMEVYGLVNICIAPPLTKLDGRQPALQTLFDDILGATSRDRNTVSNDHYTKKIIIIEIQSCKLN